MAKLVEALHSATSATLEMAPVSQGHENMKTKYTFLSTHFNTVPVYWASRQAFEKFNWR